jgi:hypothetical protein
METPDRGLDRLSNVFLSLAPLLSPVKPVKASNLPGKLRERSGGLGLVETGLGTNLTQGWWRPSFSVDRSS